MQTSVERIVRHHRPGPISKDVAQQRREESARRSRERQYARWLKQQRRDQS